MKKWVLITLLTVTAFSLFLANNAFAIGRRGRIFGGRCAPVSCGTICNPTTICTTTACTTICATPVVETIIPVYAYPVLVPAFQFQYVPTTYAVPTVPVAGYPQAYPVVQQPAYGYPQGYGIQPNAYGVQGMQPNTYNPQQQQFNLSRKDQIRELAKALIEEMNKLADGASDVNPDNGPPSVPQPQLQSKLPPQTFPRRDDAQLTQQVAFNAMGRVCSHCHTGVGAKKEFQLFTQPGHLNQTVNWKKVKDELESGHMPPKDTQFQVTLYERQSILEWLRQIGVN